MSKPTIAFYAGSFDPVTLGHLDIILRGSEIFDELIVGIGRNPEKPSWFRRRHRVELLRPHIDGSEYDQTALKNVRIICYGGLTVKQCRPNLTIDRLLVE